MLATSARESPCTAFCCASSLDRAARTWLFSSENEIPSGNFRESSPFGPLTDTVDPSMLTVTPLGTGTGILPIRDIVGVLLPDEGEQLAPVWALRAWASDMRPLDVLRMAMPSPLRTRGISVTP